MAKELKATCSVDASSILRSRDAETLQSFTWKQLLSQLEKTAPTTTRVLTMCITDQKSAKDKNGPRSANENAIVGLCCGILLRARNQRMNLIQRLISTIRIEKHLQCEKLLGLAGGTPKSVGTRNSARHNSNPLQRHSHVHFRETF